MPQASQPAPYHLYQQSMLALVERVREIDVGTFESAPRERLFTELQPRTTSLLAQANHLVRSVLDACDVPDESVVAADAAEGFELAIDAVIERASTSDSRIADVAYMAQVELRQRAARLDGLGGDETTVLIAECDGALRRVTKALCAIDRAMAHASHTPACLDYLSELELSLRVRRCYARFRSRVLADGVLGDGSESADDVVARLRRTGTEIAILVGLPIYPSLRLNDRLQLRGLQQRIVAWMRPSDRDLGAGQRIWKDVSAFVAILRHVGRRQELFEHDARVVLAAVESLAHHGEITERCVQELARLDGRDDDVDALLATGSRDTAQWAPLLERLVLEIGNRTPSSRP